MTHAHADRPLLGILLMLGFCLMIPFSDALAKILGDDFPLLQLILVRFLAQAGLLLPVALLMRATIFPSGRVVRLAAIRTALQICGIGMMFSALRFLPLADAVAIAFVMPFIMLILGHYVLKEEVGPRRMAACAVGFVGTMMVVQPSFAAVGWPALLPLGVAVIFAFFMLVTRQVAKDIDPVALQGLGGLIGLPILAPLLLLPGIGGTPPLTGWIAPPDAGALWLLIALGVTGSLGHLLMTWSLRFAPASTLAPMQYLEIPAAALVGLMLFAEFPNGLALAGIGVTIAAGLYIVVRERSVSRAAARVGTPAPPAG
ncbi:DMT family transporter [Roseicyclus persicicus]|uniref:DMT family transporter n=1 Tax=Roseicyclus persicicus TaxID=2650661 RepID=A0A7X6GVY7_9RHOB|nr:DMT family transporter [Roseibacterium persicicum]NKX43374.1 DMT family transporter [Roseibacterium persicicum]